MRRAALFLLVATLSCQQVSKREQPADETAVAMRPPAAPQVTALVSKPAPSPRMIIRTATLSVVVRDAADALRRITAAAESQGGYLAETRQWRENDQLRASAMIRVPAQHLNAVLGEIRRIAIRVESETISGQDVSEEYSDLGAQLINLEATEKELRELLGTVRQRTQKAAEVMEVYREITEVRGNIERIKGRIRYLEQMTTLSTINLELIPDILAKPVVEPGWQPLAVFRNAMRALVDSLKFIAEALIWTVVYLLPIGLVLVLFALLIRWLWKRVRPPRLASPSK